MNIETDIPIEANDHLEKREIACEIPTNSEIETLKRNNAMLRIQIQELEKLRPVWAHGYTDISDAANRTIAALAEAWSLVGAQTQAEFVGKLNALIAKAA